MPDDQITVPFVGGIDEATDPRVLPPGSLVAAINPVFSEDGQYQVRYGVSMLATTMPTSVFRLAVFLFELLAIDALGGCWSYAPYDQAFVQRDTLPSVVATHAPLYNSTSSFTSWGSAFANFTNSANHQYRVVGWIDGADNTPHAAVYDAQTNALILIAQLSPQASQNINVGVIGTTAYVIAADIGVIGHLRGYSLDLTTLAAWSAPILLSTGSYASTAGVYGCDFTASAIYIAWESVGSPTSSIELHHLNQSLGNVSSTTIATTNANTYSAMAVRATDGELAWISVVAQTAPSSSLILASTGLPSYTGSTTQPVTVLAALNVNASSIITMAIERVSSTQCVLTYDLANSGVGYAQFTTSAQVGVAQGVGPALGIASAPIYVASAATAYMYLFTSGTYYLVDLQLGTTATRIIPRLQAVLAPNIVNAALWAGGIVQINRPRPTVARGAVIETVMPIIRGPAGRQGIELFSMRSNNYAQAWAGGITLGKELYLGGEYYDGNRAAEIGFVAPPQPVGTASGTGHTYVYCYTYARVDAQGNLEEGPPSPVSPGIVSGAPPNVTLTLRYWWLTQKQRLGDAGTAGAVYLLLYRTQDTASGDSTFYRVTKEPFPIAMQDSQALTSFTFNDTLSDASLTDGTHPVLYTNTGELVHDQPETFVASTVHKNRVWGIGADQRSVWFSQTYVDGVLPAWSDANIITVDDAGEPLTCLASLYDKLLIFTRSKVYVVYGDGPSPAGTGSDLTEPQRVPSPAGCIDPRSVVNTPMGVMFQSTRGIELIDPNLTVQFVGQRVQLSTSAQGGPSTAGSLPFGSATPMGICVGAIYDAASSTVRFAFCNAEGTNVGGSGCVVVYDVRRDRWAVHSIAQGGTGASAELAQMSAIAAHPTFGVCMAHQDSAALPSSIYRENRASDPTPWLDFGQYFIPLTIQTAWIKSGDLEGWQTLRRLRLLAQYYDNHAMLLTLTRDYQSSAFEVHALSDTTINSFVAGGVEQMRLIPGPTIRHCESIQLTLHSQLPGSTPLNSGRGVGLTGVAFEVRRQRGGYRRLSSAQTS